MSSMDSDEIERLRNITSRILDERYLPGDLGSMRRILDVSQVVTALNEILDVQESRKVQIDAAFVSSNCSPLGHLNSFYGAQLIPIEDLPGRYNLVIRGFLIKEIATYGQLSDLFSILGPGIDAVEG